MTPEHIHDALNLLPADLIAETDKKRTRKPKVIHWGRFAAMAAAFLLVLGCGRYAMLMGSRSFAKSESAAEAPMMQEAPAAADEYRLEETWAPAVMESPAEAAPRDTAPAMEEPLCSVPLAPEEGNGDATAGATSHAGLCIDHAHHPAEASEDAEGSGGWCGNMTVTVSIGELTYSVSGTDAVTITDILYHLSYDPAALCRCPAEFTVDTEVGTGYEVSLTDYFVRREGAQAALTPEQAKAIREALPWE